MAIAGSGTPEDPWELHTPSGKSTYLAFRDPARTPPALVCRVGSTELSYHLRAIEDLHAMLKERGAWVPLGNADEQKPAPEGGVEAWARSADNPVGGWYGLKKGLRGRFATYVPPVARELGLVEIEDVPRSQRVRAL